VPAVEEIKLDILAHLMVGMVARYMLRSSALMDERLSRPQTQRTETTLVSPIDWTAVMFLFQDHLGITRSPEFKDNVLFLLLEAP
jgi:hypothetical protein